MALLLVLWLVGRGSFLKNDNEDYFVFYLPVAQNIVHGDGITLEGKIACAYPPGYPVLIAAVLGTAKIIHVAPSVLLRASLALYLAMSAVLIYFMALLLWNPVRALAVSLLWSSYPLILWAAKQQNSEPPFMIFFYASLLCFLAGWYAKECRKRYFFLSGILCGIAMLVRPIAIGVGIFMAVLMLFWKRYGFRKRIVFALLIILGNLIAILPWEAWMFHKTGEVAMLCRGRDGISMADGLTFALNFEGYRKGVSVPQDVRKLMEDLVPNISFELTTKQVVGLVRAEFAKHPLAVFKLLAIKAARSWYGTNSNRLESIIIFIQLIYLTLMAMAFVRFWKLRPDCRLPLAIGLVLLVYFWGMTVCVLSIVRYMVPALGLMFIFFPALKPPAIPLTSRKI